MSKKEETLEAAKEAAEKAKKAAQIKLKEAAGKKEEAEKAAQAARVARVEVKVSSKEGVAIAAAVDAETKSNEAATVLSQATAASKAVESATKALDAAQIKLKEAQAANTASAATAAAKAADEAVDAAQVAVASATNAVEKTEAEQATTSSATILAAEAAKKVKEYAVQVKEYAVQVKKYAALQEEMLRQVVSGSLGNSDTPKSQKDVIEELTTKSFDEEVQQDKNVFAASIRRGQKAKEELLQRKLYKDTVYYQEPKQTADLNLEVAGADILKRTLLLMGSSNLQLKSDDDVQKAASENELPVSTYLAHGARVLITIPAGSDNQLMNWLATGNPATSGLSNFQTQEEAIQVDKFIYNRSAATHDTSIDENGTVKELKGAMIGARDFLKNKLLGKKTKHYGIDLALDAEWGGKDSQGNPVTRPDGDHGHLYFHYTPPKKDKPGALLIGLEGSAPSSHKHSKTGASDPISPTGGSLWQDLKRKLKVEQKGANTSSEQGTEAKPILPKKYNGMSVTLDKGKLEALVAKTDMNEYGEELAASIPKASLEEFKMAQQLNQLHESPARATVTVTVPNKPKTLPIWQKLANKLSFGFAYKDEIEAYKEAKELYKTAQAIQRGHTERANKSNPQTVATTTPERRSSVTPSHSPDSRTKHQGPGTRGIS